MTSKSSPRQLNTRLKAQLMSASEIERTLVRLVHEIIEKNDGAIDLGLIGIRSRGVFLAQRIGKMIERIEKTPVPVGTLDITLYRDDLSPLAKPVVQKSDIGFPIAGKKIVLVISLIVVVVATVLNLFTAVRVMGDGTVPLMSGLAAALGGYMAMYQWKLLRVLNTGRSAPMT